MSRSFDDVIREADLRANRPRAARVLRDLVVHVRELAMLSLELSAYTRHDDSCDVMIQGLVTERDESGRPIVVRSRLSTDPPASCTCGLADLVKRLPEKAHARARRRAVKI
jgi:hypothetical protein